MELKYGGWNKADAGIIDDVTKIEVKDTTWQVLMEHALFDK